MRQGLTGEYEDEEGMSMEPLLELQSVTKTYTAHHLRIVAVDEVSFSLRPGEILGIMGTSGSGKSTLARLMARLESVDQGEIRLAGEKITRLQGRGLIPVYDKLQLVFQDHVESFDPRRTIGDGISEGLRNKGVAPREARERTAELLSQCGLSTELAGRYPWQLSGGQCQRAAIARALSHEPELIILDEATSALDATVQQEIISLLAGLQKEKGMAYVFICHNPALVKNFCQRVIVLDKGKIVEQGTVTEVFEQPRSRQTKNLLAAVLSI